LLEPQWIVRHGRLNFLYFLFSVKLDGEVECDEVYEVAGHKGHPEAVKKNGAKVAVTV
jgi:hypothetical protein